MYILTSTSGNTVYSLETSDSTGERERDTERWVGGEIGTLDCLHSIWIQITKLTMKAESKKELKNCHQD